MCHADYGMFGTVLTKIGGMRHVWLYYTRVPNTPIEEAKKTIHLREPFPNDNCMQCHSTQDLLWLKVPDHKPPLDDVRADRVSCASRGATARAPFFRPRERGFARGTGAIRTPRRCRRWTMTPRTTGRLLACACVLALVALGLMVWSLFDPRPIPVIAAMSIGQVLGTMSLGSFVYVVLSDVRARLRPAPIAKAMEPGNRAY